MRINDYPPVYIFSVSGRQAIRDLYNIANEKGIKLQRMVGCYKGEVEPSWLMDAEDFHHAGIAKLLEANGQESVLYLDNQRSGWLLFKPDYLPEEDTRVYLGQWREVSESFALKQQNYTQHNGRYFTCM